MRDFLFDTPYWALGLFALVGVALWLSGNGRQDKRLQLAGYAALAVAVLLGLLSYFIDTDKETVAKGTRALAAAVENKDKATAERLLHPKVSFGGAPIDKPTLVNQIGTAADDYKLKDIRLSSIEVKPDGQDLAVNFSATANLEVGGMGGTLPSTWQFIWEKTPDRGWQVRVIRPINSPGMDVAQLTDRVRRK
jgi:hypothetical protein